MIKPTDEQFWSVFQQVLSIHPTAQLSELDGALTQSLDMMGSNLAGHLSDEESLHHAVSTLLHSPLFLNHSQRVTNSIILILIDPSTPLPLIFVACLVLLLNGFENSLFFRTLRTINLSALHLTDSSSPSTHLSPSAELSQLIPVLLAIGTRVGLVPSSFINPLYNHSHSNQHRTDTISDCSSSSSANERYAERKLGPLLSGLLYELCRVQKLEDGTLGLFSEQLIDNLFQLVELTRDQEDETFNYNLIKLIIALNEQFMLAGLHHESSLKPINNTPRHHRRKSHHASDAENNIIIRTMKLRLDESKTFGENLIFILNRASHSTSEGLCVSLLILKILYLLFTTPGTHEYFYTNDLCVLVDIFIRELSDLPDESNDLRHTYLRVLHPLLTHTQLRSYPYKREQIRHVLLSHIKYAHLQDVNATTRRLVDRNLQSEWCLELERTTDSLRRPGLAKLSCEPMRSLSVETVGSQLSGGGSIAEVITSNSGSMPQSGSSTALGGSHQSCPTSPSPNLQSHNTALSNPHSISQGVPSSVVLNSLSQAFVQVVIAESHESSEDSQLTRPIQPIASSPSSPKAIDRPPSIVSTRSTSPNSDNSRRPSSSCSMSHSPARRPAPKPPTSKRKGQSSSHLSPDPNPAGPSSTGIPAARQYENDQYYVPARLTSTEGGELEAYRRASVPIPDSLSPSSSHRPSPRPLDKPLRRAAPSPPLPLSPAHPDEPRLQQSSRRRKAPLPPTEPFSKLRSTKSSSHLTPHSSTPIPCTPTWKSVHGRVVSLSRDKTDSTLAPYPDSHVDKSDNNPFGE
ncbi:hypothetical protein PGTUg99_033212 [Puccinia graminis f. sp. tritici]|uniref:SPIN90/Ldb17 leucine-rich domain-containing protein n=2 Tax=Puccinia graminis f. sp. tritici TaxID=56615 RepID=E3JQB9_PUCGT|nr:uncharacterized protein PGTG_00439 [Puccinia graminis f. sp. tritici CRL 75-36-700-3]EFP74483.2 hypothetical protein PGTG_00439 [Puccinia graminis f. sp. tritici CRL 75-36-700-3]KAA1127255.1 hypothetical protein PGTUg99_033212 [Puccinia graminis f. sp. tritici]